MAEHLDAGLAVLRRWGLEPVVFPHVRDVAALPYLAGDDERRARDVENAWCDVRVSEGVHGPWVSGRLRPGLSDETIYAVRASHISGHWVFVRSRKSR